MTPKTICGYDLTDVRKSLREAVGRRDRRAAQRWTAELVATPGAIGSLWAALWLSCETTMEGNPTLPILLSQVWANVANSAKAVGAEWAAFRNDEKIRLTVAEMTSRILDYPRQPIITWPSKEVALYDVSTTLDARSSATADSSIVLSCWSRNHDSMELRQLSGHWIDALQRGDLRISLSIMLWSLLPTTKIQCGSRGPASLPTGARASVMWFWFNLGASILKSLNVHAGWLTMHDVIVEAMTVQYKRWSSADRLKILLFWTIQIKAAMSGSVVSWSLGPVAVTDVDLPYKEIAAEIAGGTIVEQAKEVPKTKQESKQTRVEKQMKEADDQILALLGVT